MQINLTLLLLNMYFSVCIVHFHVIWGPGQFGLKWELWLTPPCGEGFPYPGFAYASFLLCKLLNYLYHNFWLQSMRWEVWWVAFEADTAGPRFGNGTLRLQHPFVRPGPPCVEIQPEIRLVEIRLKSRAGKSPSSPHWCDFSTFQQSINCGIRLARRWFQSRDFRLQSTL